MRGERVLKAVEVMVQDCHFAIEMVGEGLGGGGVGIHGCGNGRGNIWR